MLTIYDEIIVGFICRFNFEEKSKFNQIGNGVKSPNNIHSTIAQSIFDEWLMTANETFHFWLK